MTTFVDLLSAFKDELTARYKSPFWGPAILAFFGIHWKIVIFLLLDRPSASVAIQFIQQDCTWLSALTAFALAVLYVVLFPWAELLLSTMASQGKRKRNDFQIRERAREITSRRIIAEQAAATITLELRNTENQSKLSDIELAKSYQAILFGEQFSRWLNDVKHGAINSSLSNSISSYLQKCDSVEGHFIDPNIDGIHRKFIESISTLDSTINDRRPNSDDQKKTDLIRAAEAALSAHQSYRRTVRELLGI